jgi:hypothetical protein
MVRNRFGLYSTCTVYTAAIRRGASESQLLSIISRAFRILIICIRRKHVNERLLLAWHHLIGYSLVRRLESCRSPKCTNNGMRLATSLCSECRKMATADLWNAKIPMDELKGEPYAAYLHTYESGFGRLRFRRTKWELSDWDRRVHKGHTTWRGAGALLPSPFTQVKSHPPASCSRELQRNDGAEPMPQLYATISLSICDMRHQVEDEKWQLHSSQNF